MNATPSINTQQRPRRNNRRTYRPCWWTKERVNEGLARFYRDFGFAPTATEQYQQWTKGTVVNKSGVGNPYPSFASVLRYYGSFREAWTAIGVAVNRDWEPWTPLEDWYIAEAAGIFTRIEIAEYLNRTSHAVHRRLYDLGIDTRKARGWSMHRLAQATGISPYIVQRYADQGKLPYFRGTRLLYFDPADFLVINEIDWNAVPVQSPELENAIRKSLMMRLVSVLAGKDWRFGRIYQPHKIYLSGREHHRRQAAQPTPKPTNIKVDTWAKVKKQACTDHWPELVGRTGYVHKVFWSPYGSLSSSRRNHSKSSGEWVASVEFKKTSTQARLNRTLPVSALQQTARVSAAQSREGK